MATLLEQCLEIREGLERANLANQVRQELATLSARAKEWSERKGKIKQWQPRLQWLPLNGDLQTEVTSANAEVVSCADRARQRLEESGVSGLSKDGLWISLLQCADKAIQKTEEGARAAWRAHVDQLGEVTPPGSLEGMVLRTPSNEEAMARYRHHYTAYQNLVRQVPTDRTAVVGLQETVQRLREARAALTLSAPEDVRRFLNAVDLGGAPLTWLTPEVLQWLEQHDDISRFVVRPKAANR